MLRYVSDVRTLLYMVLTTLLLVVQWRQAEFDPWLYVLALHMAVAVSVIAHNHNHLKIWKNRTLNALTDYWLTLFYGFPAFGWIPTHNLNHHKRVNKEGDYTITYRVSERNNLFTLLSYPSISAYHQQKPIRDYLGKMRRTQTKRFVYYLSQYALLIAFVGALLWLDWKKALLYVVVPQQVSLFAVLSFNYLQHVHADEESKWNHSRNIVGPVMNWFLFNNGYHTIHHMKPGLHWSRTPAAHAEIAHHIDPRLNEPSFWWLVVRVYILGLFSARCRTDSMRLERLTAER
ncbi:MAG: fatty acid desaturase [Myxococcota bacterium]